ncbi:MAG TPA: histidine--tRNA ligase [Solirubrobacterales bacterium]|jgi:histidyl-tRNA synthetase|nr:histidine--tRNA ligase [Solirubrobacterales bacterium]
MASKYQAPRGTFDILPEAARARARLERAAAEIFARAGYEPIATPAFEDTALFERGVGQSTDIVRKEMFTFEDKGERSLTLRPEGTASVCRAYLEHGMHKLAQPVKLSYLGPFFRHERPQAGRYRQFHQLGIECIGTDSPLADAEVIMLLSDLLGELGVPGVELRLGSLGSFEARRAYLEDLKAHLHANEGELSEDVRERIDLNPLRAFDSDHEGTRGVMASAPTIVGQLEGEDAEHFAEVRALLDAAGIEYVVDETLVRGLDYYTRTIFSFVCDALGAQSEIGGGGRYDGLIEQLGGPATPAVGFAAGIERILLALDEEVPAAGRDAFIAVADPGQRGRAMALAVELRHAGVSVEVDLAGRSLKGQLKHADRIGAGRVLILEADGSAQLREMKTGEQRAADPGKLLDEMTGGDR